ncbi:hypothetical protein [Psychroserpens sp.]|uniref:hypothetical protein n=1 Tax=Psychroserpens sp. TaxID=2020870 RepID=UPI002B26BF52|nr:hypothetical protein [Psychroserpens sp.]
MMKNFKLFLLSFTLIAGFLTSCTNNDTVVEDQNINESEAITISLNRLAQQFNTEGDVIPTSNPAGNIVFDFCFDFVYPLNLSYNNGTTVSVNSLDDLIIILINSTDDLYINGVEFPFNVERYNASTDAIEIVTINNEAEFFDLLEDCDFDGIDSCDCDDSVNPVCVEVQDPNGESFIITYPNECLAMCDGFTPNDFAENCEDDYNCPGGNGCFDFNFPITIVTDDNVTITIESQEELDNALYNVYYFDFVYPFEVTLTDGSVVTVSSENDFVALLDDCFNYEEDCDLEIEFLEDTLMFCDTFYEVEIFNPNGDIVDVNSVNFNPNNELIVNGTPTVTESAFWNMICSDNDVVLTINGLLTFTQLNGDWELTSYSNDNLIFTNTEGYTININLDCNTNNPNNCSEQEVFDFLIQCNWYINTSLYNTVVAEYAQFSADGTLEIFSEGSATGVTGTWDLSSNPATAEVFMSFNVPNSPSDMFSQLDWTVALCSEGFIVLESGNEFIHLERDCNNNSSGCTPNDIFELVTGCSWTIGEFAYIFNSDGTLIITNESTTIAGLWFIGNTGGGNSPASIFIQGDQNLNDEWFFTGCETDDVMVTSSANPSSVIEFDCN